MFSHARPFLFFCSKPKADLTCSTWTMTGHWTDEKDILSSHWSSTSDRAWCSPKHSHTMRVHIQHAQFMHTLKRTAGGLDFRRQSHFYPKVSLSSTCYVTFKWNTTCSDPHFANNIISALTYVVPSPLQSSRPDIQSFHWSWVPWLTIRTHTMPIKC